MTKDRNTVLQSSVPITLDGNEYVLRYRAFAFIAYAERTGGDLLSDMQAMGRRLTRPAQIADGDGGADAPAPVSLELGVTFKTLCDVLWVGLLDAQPDITRDQAQRMFGFEDFRMVAETITRAISSVMPSRVAERPTNAPIVETLPSHSGLTNGIASPQVSAPLAESPQPNFSSSPPPIFGT
jgi:hypothetical protein